MFNIRDAILRAARCPTPASAYASIAVQIGIDDDHSEYFSNVLRGETFGLTAALNTEEAAIEWDKMDMGDRVDRVGAWAADEIKSICETWDPMP